MKFSLPSKTFLMGEYLALDGGPALLLAHGPHFECEFQAGKAEIPFHPDSPAGIWVDLHEELFEKTSITFRDPHQGGGGFGASTAQFLAVYMYVLAQQNMLRNGVEFGDMQKWAINEDYQNIFEDEDVPPSGYDLIAQLQGGLSVVQSEKHNISQVVWPYETMNIAIYKTKTKINTHEHLKELELTSNTLKALEAAVAKSVSALTTKKQDAFIDGLKEFSIALEKAKLVAPATLELMSAWNKVPGVLWARGCGAMGADVFATFVEKEFKPSTELTKNLTLVWSSADGFNDKPQLGKAAPSPSQEHL